MTTTLQPAEVTGTTGPLHRSMSLPTLLEQIFSIPLAPDRFGDPIKYLVYAPLKGIAFLANGALVNAITAQCERPNPSALADPRLAFLHHLDFFTPDKPPGDPYTARGVAYDTVVLFLTNRCNLRCAYCYASSGDFTPKTMTWDTAKAAVDQVFGDVIARGEKRVTLGFHGGGEPTMNWKLLTRTVDYARAQAARRELELQVTGAFNGYWSPSVRRYMLANFTDISLSFDGLREVQDAQRPTARHLGSFDRVTETLRALDDSPVRYGIRMTVTRAHVRRLAESVAYICEQFRPAKIQAEPVFLEGRATEAQLVGDCDAFVNQFIAAHEIAARHGIELYYSAARPDVVLQRFCLAPCRALIVTADGDVTTCFETFGKEHPLSAQFLVGRYRDGHYDVDGEKLEKHFARTADSIAYCEGCYCRWHCAGDCAIKASVAGRVQDFVPTHRCTITRELTEYLLLKRIHDSGGLLWRRAVPERSPRVV